MHRQLGFASIYNNYKDNIYEREERGGVYRLGVVPSEATVDIEGEGGGEINSGDS